MPITIQPNQLVLVYNADSGTLRAAWDIAHKILSPATYGCHLCALTHGAFSETVNWRFFRERYPDALVMLHRDEFRALYPDVLIKTPCILRAEVDGSFATVLDEAEIVGYKQVDELILELERLMAQNQRTGN